MTCSKQNGHRVLAAGRVHADLLFEPSAALQRAVQRIQTARRRRHSVRLGERHLRDERTEEADQHAENITFVPDGNGEFTKGMNMLVEKADLGFGPRSWRYSMLVRDGVVEENVRRTEQTGRPFEVRRRHHAEIHGAGIQSAGVGLLFTNPGCPFCPKPNRCCKRRGIRV